MMIKRGDIFYADLSPVIGSEQGGVRPVVVVQNDIGNKYSPTTIVAAITSQLNKAKLPTHVNVRAKDVPLPKNSVILLEQLRTIDKKRLREKIGKFDKDVMDEVDAAVKVSLAMKYWTAYIFKRLVFLLVFFFWKNSLNSLAFAKLFIYRNRASYVINLLAERYMEKIKIFGVEIFNIDNKECEKILRDFLKTEDLKKIYTPNTEIVMAAKRDEKLRHLINSGDLILADGIGLIHASKMRKKPLKERVTGFDTSIKLLELADEMGLNLYFLGGKEGVAEDAAKSVNEKYKNLHVAAYHNGYFNSKIDGEVSPEEKKIIEEINANDIDIIFVGFGFPRQEKWIDEFKDDLKAKVIIGNGGVLDILSGRANRAPEIFIKLGLEWLYRLIKNPSRIKRQIDLPKFLLAVMRDKNSVEWGVEFWISKIKQLIL